MGQCSGLVIMTKLLHMCCTQTITSLDGASVDRLNYAASLNSSASVLIIRASSIRVFPSFSISLPSTLFTAIWLTKLVLGLTLPSLALGAPNILTQIQANTKLTALGVSQSLLPSKRNGDLMTSWWVHAHWSTTQGLEGETYTDL